MNLAHAGHRIFERVFSRQEMVRANEALDRAPLERTKAGARHVLSVPAVRVLADDPRMLALAQQFLGPGSIPFRATLFDKSSTANWLVVWHQDTALPLRQQVENPAWGPWSTKAGLLYAHAPAAALEQVVALRVSLDDSTAANGPLRVLPGTHAHGVLTDEAIAALTESVAPVDCITSAGGVVAMRPLVVHASSKSTDANPRRVLHIEYAAVTEFGPGLELVTG